MLSLGGTPMIGGWTDGWYALGCKASLTNKKLKLPFDKPTVVLEMAMHFLDMNHTKAESSLEMDHGTACLKNIFVCSR